MFFIHMISRTDGIIAFSQFTSHIGLHVDGYVRLVCFEPDEHEPFAMYADGKRGFGKQILGNFGVKLQCECAYFFDVHRLIDILQVVYRAKV